MTPSLFYRIAAVLLVLFAAGHTLGFARTDPTWGVDALVGSMRSSRFAVQGVQRSYWDFYVGFGLFVTLFLLFSALLAWALGSLPAGTLALMPLVRWGLAGCFVGVTVLSFRYFFVIPATISGLTTVCLLIAAWQAGKPA